MLASCSVPFFIAAPTTTLDPNLESGKLIEIEERNPEELTHHGGKETAAPGINVMSMSYVFIQLRSLSCSKDFHYLLLE